VIGTEAEFSKKRCTLALPLLIARAINFESMNAAMARENVSLALNCIGSKCAQWCWYDYANDVGETHFLSGSREQFQKGRRDPSSVGTMVKVPARGYCGLTGGRE
jgi:hypothetical protein